MLSLRPGRLPAADGPDSSSDSRKTSTRSPTPGSAHLFRPFVCFLFFSALGLLIQKRCRPFRWIVAQKPRTLVGKYTIRHSMRLVETIS